MAAGSQGWNGSCADFVKRPDQDEQQRDRDRLPPGRAGSSATISEIR